jgi:ABC-type amino acid transport substrate-binding protein
MSDGPSNKWGIDRWVGVSGVLVAFFALLIAVLGLVLIKEAREEMRAYWSPALKVFLILVIVSFVCSVGIALWRTRGLKDTRAKLKQAETRVSELNNENKELKDERDKRRIDRGRWETVTKIRFGHLPYDPFLEYALNGTPSGLAVEWLNQLLDYSLGGSKVQISPDKRKRAWDNILQGLIEGEYDVVATPLFATFDRSKQVAFTAPLFFSNIGLYVSKDTAQLPAWRDITTAGGLRSAIKRAGELKFFSVKGEISEKLANKYADKNSINSLGSDIILSSLFSDIARMQDSQCAVFCESFYAHFQPEVKSGAVVNVLPWYQILYPVCFAVRQGDYQLVNLLNIRLLQFAQKGGAIPMLANRLSKSREPDLTLESVKRHFVAEWPCSMEMEKPNHA